MTPRRRPPPATGVHAFAGGRAAFGRLTRVSLEGRPLYLTRCGAYVGPAELVLPGTWPQCPACQRAQREDPP